MSDHNRYHNKTIYERYLEWKERNGSRSFNHLYNCVSVLICLLIIFVLMITVLSLPPFGSPDNPTNNEVSQKYIEDSLKDTGATNIVSGMILDYRAFDTFGESTVLFVACIAILTLLRNTGGEQDEFNTLLKEMEEPRHDVILKSTALILTPIIMVFGIYVVMNGHLSPGGGFSGGAILGSGLILYASSFGTKRARQFFSYKTWQHIVTFSLSFYAIAKGFSFFTGANHIPNPIPLGEPGAILSGGLILPLNIAVGLIVASTFYVIFVLFSKGEMK